MWLRDSSAQVHQYLRSEKLVNDPEMQRIIEGLIRRQLVFIQRVFIGNMVGTNWEGSVWFKFQIEIKSGR
jgi:meiotically up-regulated gene 157 (Mug157) protein